MQKYILFLLLCYSITACNSPADINSQRDKKIIDRLDDAIYFIPEKIDLGIVHPDQTASYSFSVYNNTDTNINISSITALNNSVYHVLGLTGDMVLAPKNESGSSITLTLSFASTLSATYFDSIMVNTIDDPILPTKAMVPIVYPKDITFDTLSLAAHNITTSKLYIINTADFAIDIDTILFENPAFTFANDISYPLPVPAKSEILELINFTPSTTGHTASYLLLRYNNALLADTVALLNAIVIN